MCVCVCVCVCVLNRLCVVKCKLYIDTCCWTYVTCEAKAMMSACSALQGARWLVIVIVQCTKLT